MHRQWPNPIAFHSGHAFRNGKLYAPGLDGSLLFRAWPPLAWRLSSTGQWRRDLPLTYSLGDMEQLVTETDAKRIRNETNRIFNTDKIGRARSYAAYLAAIPLDARAAVRTFRSRSWHMLCLYARCPGADDLMAGNPGLAFALASNWIFHKPRETRPWRAARAIIGRKRRVIAGWLGFPETNAAVRIIGKFPRHVLSVSALYHLKAGLYQRPELLHLLSHLPTINPSVIRFATDTVLSRYITPAFLVDLADADVSDHRETVEMFEDLCRLAGALYGDADDWLKRSPLTSLAALRERHDECTVAYNVASTTHLTLFERIMGHGISFDLETPFPPPPVPPTPDIQPILTVGELQEEGKAQHHCCGIYARDVLAGKTYIYRVTSPERATLSLVNRDGHWCLEQLKLACNQAPSEELTETVKTWLMQHLG